MIRMGTILDINRIVELALKYKEEAVYGAYTIDVDNLMQKLSIVLSDPNHCFLVAYVDNKLVGMFWGCSLPPLPWTNEEVGLDITFYILPEYRGRLIGAHLIKKWVKWCKSKGCKEVRLSVSSGITTERTIQLYESQGFVTNGYVLTKEV